MSKQIDFSKEEKVIANFLEEFNSYNTQRTYRTALRKYQKLLKISSMEKYIKDKPNIDNDLRTFLKLIESSPSKTRFSYGQTIKLFFEEVGVPVSKKEWKKIKRRGFMPKRVRGETRDKKPTKEILKKALNHMSIKGRAQTLFLVSSGARIGETLSLVKNDFDFESNPPSANIPDLETKGGVGGRFVFFSYEAKEAIQEWLAIKDTVRKRGEKNGFFNGERVFEWNNSTAQVMWMGALKKAGYGEQDTKTKRGIYHLHTTRKFFSSNCGLEDQDRHMLMGHSGYLDNSYYREEKEELGKKYLEISMSNLSVYDVEQKLEPILEAHRELEQILKQRDQYIESLKTELEIVRKRQEETFDMITDTKTQLEGKLATKDGEFTALKQNFARLESVYEATAQLYKQLNSKELEKTIRKILREEKGK